MNKPHILLLGAGGHCRSVIEAIESHGRYEVAGMLDLPEKVGQQVLGYPVLGTDNELSNWIRKFPNAVITVGQTKNAAVRERLFNKLKEMGATLPLIVASTALVSKHASVQEGTVVLHQAFINAGAKIGVNCIVNSGAVIDHDAIVGDHSHISTGAKINGECVIGDGVLIGSNAVVLQGIRVGSKALVGAGAVVLREVKPNTTVVGNPAKEKLS